MLKSHGAKSPAPEVPTIPSISVRRMKFIHTVIFLGFGFINVGFVAAEVRLEIQMIEPDLIQATFRNEGNSSEELYLWDSKTEWNFKIWIESTKGELITSCLFCDGNWYTDPPNISFMEAYNRDPLELPSEKILETTFSLLSALEYLRHEPSEKELEEELKSKSLRVLHLAPLLPEATNPPMRMPIERLLSEENGPFRLKVRSNGVESNWIEFEKIEFEQDHSLDSEKSGASLH